MASTRDAAPEAAAAATPAAEGADPADEAPRSRHTSLRRPRAYTREQAHDELPPPIGAKSAGTRRIRSWENSKRTLGPPRLYEGPHEHDRARGQGPAPAFVHP